MTNGRIWATSILPNPPTPDILSKRSSRSSIGKGEGRKSSENRGVSRQGGHVVDTAGPRRGANCHRPADVDSELAMLIAAWADMPESIRTGIAAMVRAVTRG